MYKTTMWRECPFIRSDKVYRFQTDDPHMHKKMRQRKDFKLVLWGLNKKLWVYASERNTLEKAKRTLGNLTHGKVIKGTVKGEYWAESTPYIAPKQGIVI